MNRYLVELENWLESRANDALDVLSDIRYSAITIMRTFSYFLIFFFSRKLSEYASYEQFIARFEHRPQQKKKLSGYASYEQSVARS